MSPLDFCVFILYLIGVLCIGWFSARHAGQDDEYFLASRSMGWLPIGLSVMVTSFSAINYLAIPSEIFGYGLYHQVIFHRTFAFSGRQTAFPQNGLIER